MQVKARIRASGIVAAVAFLTVLAVAPAQAFDAGASSVSVIRGAITTATVTADEAGLVTGPAAPVVDLAVTTLGLIAFATVPIWLPWAQDTMHNLVDGQGQGPNIQKPSDAGNYGNNNSVTWAVLSMGGFGRNPGNPTGPTVLGTFTTSGAFVTPAADINPEVRYHLTCQEELTGKISFANGTYSGTYLDAQNSAGTHAGYAKTGNVFASCPASGSGGGTNIPLSARFSPATNADWQAAGKSASMVTVDHAVDWINPSPPAAPAGSAGAAPKTITTTVRCLKSDGTTFDLSVDSPATDPGVTVPSCAASVAGSHAVNTTISAPHFPGDATPGNIWQAAPTGNAQYPACDPTTAATPCLLQIKLDGAPCVVGAAGCVGWTSLLTTAPSRLECDWGTYVLPLSDCDVLERAYEPDGAPATKPNTDGDPATWDGTTPATDPGNQPSPTPTAEPGTGTDPSASPSATADPGTGTNPSPDPVPGTGGQPDPSDPAAQQCWPSGWGMFNPAEWVLRPLGCAFIPKTSIQTRVTTIIPTLEAVPPVSWFAAPLTGPGGGGCPAWVVQVGGMSKNIVCDSPFIGAVRGARGPLFGLVASAMVWPLLRSLWYAAIPILRVTPAGGK